jgi:hypothetical protein
MRGDALGAEHLDHPSLQRVANHAVCVLGHI